MQCQTSLSIADRVQILQYGLWQDYGTRRWFSRKYYASVMRLKEFYEENIGKEFCGLVH